MRCVVTEPEPEVERGGRGERESFIQSRKYAHPEHMCSIVTQEMLTNWML